ncbi:SET domain-containing 8 [Hyphodiscus hymeniophilus]|uniref:SET domain-containing 8 n=1 Tax=Hyphodiscus hymeniophilus TaxID=353542 RepID=A0A9P7B0S7_9HELO|nr:SET domain-containing 8 [Hyphodiscus hymeniophilus]
MRKAQLPIAALPAWSKLNDASFIDISVQNVEAKGFGLATERALSSVEAFDVPTLLIIPKDLILSAEAIEELAKVDQHFKQLLEAAGGKSLRGDVLLFLLMQITIGSPDHGQLVGVSNPWTEYVKILPDFIPLPTMWTEEERVMLVGTSLESALTAKMSALLREFESLREMTVGISWCDKCWWENEALHFSDWVLLDAWYRSRSLELPKAGESMVPCLDMANHSSSANAYYEQNSDNSVTLLLRPNMKLDKGAEVTISYGATKSAAEMLFSYGFIDEQTDNAIVLPIEAFEDDPLGKAKLAAFAGRPIVRISVVEGKVLWESPFLYLLSLNEEDGLEFKVLQQNDGSRSQLRVFWQGTDVTEQTTNFEALVSHHELEDVFKLRVVALLHDRIRKQLELLYESDEAVELAPMLNERCQNAALQLRKAEAGILEEAFSVVGMQKNKLLENEGVLRYLGSMERPEHPQNGLSNEDDDFS